MESEAHTGPLIEPGCKRFRPGLSENIRLSIELIILRRVRYVFPRSFSLQNLIKNHCKSNDRPIIDVMIGAIPPYLRQFATRALYPPLKKTSEKRAEPPCAQ